MNSIGPSAFAPILRWRLIEDGRFVRLIYVDEAGTSPKEPVRVVASIIVHGDEESRHLTSEIERVVSECVPENIRDGFIFHAMEVFNGGKVVKREDWAFDDRLDFLKEIVCLPFVNDIPIGLGLCFNGYFNKEDDLLAALEEDRIPIHVFEHGIAFAKCASRSDRFLTKYLDGKETGVMIAENIDSNRAFLAKMGMFHKRSPQIHPPEEQVPTMAQKVLGKPPPHQVEEIKNILDVPHFVDKRGAPLLQLADACAFCFRRFFARQSHGEDLVMAMLGPEAGRHVVEDPVWFTGASSGLFNTRKYWGDEQIRESEESRARLLWEAICAAQTAG